MLYDQFKDFLRFKNTYSTYTVDIYDVTLFIKKIHKRLFSHFSHIVMQ